MEISIFVKNTKKHSLAAKILYAFVNKFRLAIINSTKIKFNFKKKALLKFYYEKITKGLPLI